MSLQKAKFVMVIAVLMLALAAAAPFAQEEKNSKLSIAEALREVILAEGPEAGVRKYQELKKTAAEQYDFSEPELNRLGYQLLGERKYQAAVSVLKLNTESYPDSPNVYDSLAEAYLRNNQPELAVASYRKVLAKLPGANLPENLRGFLKNNAESKLAILTDPEKQKPSTVIEDFLSNPKAPFGKLNPKAAQETEQWGQLAGVWECEQFALVNGQWFSGWPATWVFKYVLDGFAVQDLWFQKEIDLPPPLANLGRDYAGTNLRIYDPLLKKWRVAWFQNNPAVSGTANAMQTFEAEFKDGEIVMVPTPQRTPQTRIVFHNITESSFDWRTETSEDGETWTTTFKIKGRRVQ